MAEQYIELPKHWPESDIALVLIFIPCNAPKHFHPKAAFTLSKSDNYFAFAKIQHVSLQWSGVTAMETPIRRKWREIKSISNWGTSPDETNRTETGPVMAADGPEIIELSTINTE